MRGISNINKLVKRNNLFSLDSKKPKKIIQKNIKIEKDRNLDSTNKNETEIQNFFNTENNNKDVIEYLEKEIYILNSEKHINEIVKMFEIFQKELFSQLGEKYNNLTINTIMQNNFEIIIKYLLNFCSFYSNKYKICISELKKNFNKYIINNYMNNNNNIIILDENIKKSFLSQEENITKLIDKLSLTIKNFNNEYNLALINFENNINSFNNEITEVKNKFELLNQKDNLINYISNNIKYNEIKKDIENIYLINMNFNKDIKFFEHIHKLFFSEAKNIFNDLRIYHKIKMKKYQFIFDLILKQNRNDKIRKSSEIKYLKINLNKINNNIKTRNLNINNSKNNSLLNKTIDSLQKNKINLKLNQSQNISHNNSFNKTTSLKNKIIDNNTNNEIYYISQIMLEFFDKMKTLQKAIINKESNIIEQKKDFEKYKKGIIQYIKNLMKNNYYYNHQTEKIFLSKYYKIKHEIEYNLIIDNTNIINENKLYKNVLNKLFDLISNDNIEKNINKDIINIIVEEMSNFINKSKKEIKELKEINEKLKKDNEQYKIKINKNIESKKNLIFDSTKDLNSSLSFRDKINNNNINTKIKSIQEEDSNDINNNITASFKKLSDINDNNNLNINEEIINFQINLQNRIKCLEKENEEQKNQNYKFFMEIKSDINNNNDNNNNENINNNLIKLYEEEIKKNKILAEEYISKVIKINNSLVKYYQNLDLNINNEQEDNFFMKKSINNENLNFDYTSNYNFNNLNIDLIKAEMKEIKNKLNEKEEEINELKDKLNKQNLIQKDKIYKPLRKALETLINEINLNEKIKITIKELLNIALYSNEEIEKIFQFKEDNVNIIGIFKF